MNQKTENLFCATMDFSSANDFNLKKSLTTYLPLGKVTSKPMLEESVRSMQTISFSDNVFYVSYLLYID